MPEVGTQHMVLTAVGPDRVGIVDDIAARIEEKGCNIEESRMAILGGEFAVIMLLTGSQEAADILTSDASQWGGKLNLRIEVRPTAPPRAPESGLPYVVESTSLDTPGIVRSLATLLRKHAVNILELETETTAAPWTGSPLFHMRARVVVPPSVHITDLREELSALAHERALDITISPLR
ncbi:glycine cleavage system protein R [Planctomycetota bacterium]